jgi:hypothetical protein
MSKDPQRKPCERVDEEQHKDHLENQRRLTAKSESMTSDERHLLG